MATSNLFHQISRPFHFPTPCTTFRPPCTAVNIHLKHRKLSLKPKTKNHLKWAIKLSLVEQSPLKSNFDLEQLVGFLYEDLPHLFDDKGIDKSAYDERVFFRDPITKHDDLSGYLFNIALLKTLFTPRFQLHWVKPDFWDSLEKNDYFSFEGLTEVFKQLRIYKTPELESPKYQILKKTANYEVRQYDPFVVVETNADKLSGNTGFNDVAGYIFGKNSTTEKIPMTTPVFTQAMDADLSKVSIQIVLPSDKETKSLPNPNQETVSLRKVEGGIAAVIKFSGKPTEDSVREKEKILRSNIIKDGLKPQPGCLLARYNDPGRTWSFIMRNEVLIWLDDFSLD
ncbi:unnamed protein product [Trifolium pratense]|uniref:Uncharacterized protein n=1 Tax=Trifolium pratense TaxID=57577 RepID=A0ACB0LBV8_TRIPR|nr:unnamed protein product [Trifolium pratense]